MKQYEENGDILTTPVYVGSIEDVEKASKCEHKRWIQSEVKLSPKYAEAIMERCAGCVATRLRVPRKRR